MQDRRVVVTGMGAISAAGAGVEQLWQALRLGTSCLTPLDRFKLERYRSTAAGQVADPLVPHNLRPGARSEQMLRYCVGEALSSAHLDLPTQDLLRVALVLGGTIAATTSTVEMFRPVRFEFSKDKVSVNDWARPEFQAMIGTLGIGGPSAMICTACSASLTAIGYGADLIRWGQADIALVGGVESLSLVDYSQFHVLKLLTSEVMRPFDRMRSGLVLGEGGGVIILEDSQFARARGAPLVAECLGYAVNATPTKKALPTVMGQAQCLTVALRRSGVAPQQVDYIGAHGTATVIGDRTETESIRLAFGPQADSVAVSAVKPIIGHLSHASGVIEAIGILASMQHDFIPPIIHYTHPDAACDLDYVANVGRSKCLNIVVKQSFGFGNNNCVVVFGRAN